MSLKVLHIINSMGIGGAEKLLVDTLPMYPKKKIDVDLLLLNGKSTFFLEDLRLRFKGKLILLGSGSVYNPVSILKLIRYVKAYDIIHVHLFPALYFVSIAKFISNSKAKLIFTEHSTTNNRVGNIFFRCIDRMIYKNYAVITAITPQVKDMLVNKLGLKNRITVIYNGINLDKIKQAVPVSREVFFNDPESCILIQVSSFSKLKDQKTVIRAMSLLPYRVKLLLVGVGKLQEECEQLAISLKLTDRVKFLGERKDVAVLLKTCDIVVQSSVSEGFGLAAVEGMAAGKPVIVSNVSGLKDIVEGSGLLFEQGSHTDLVFQIEKILGDNKYYDVIANKCYETAHGFGLEKMTDEYIKIYENQ